ncbi:MAG TPA: hypothetical protein VG408_00985 [Actinomycetota bacterium]|nr:hypothetical protein [Actinomycetota bacterium]
MSCRRRPYPTRHLSRTRSLRSVIFLSLATLLPTGDAGATLPSGSGALTRAGLTSDNVEYIGTIPLENGTWTTARLHDDHLYVSGNKSFTIFDVSTPQSPVFLSHTVTGFQFINEDIDTNGEILLITDERVEGVLHIWDVSNKASPVKLAEVPDMIDHSFACVFDCKWAYGAGGDIVDLRDPAHPKPAGRWATPPPGFWGFDTTEGRPGMVVTASREIHFLDGRKQPADPNVLALAPGPAGEFVHSIQWPSRGHDRFLLVQTETSPKPRCDARSGAMITYDASNWRKTHTFQPIDEFRPTAGMYADGKPAVSALGCSATWFKPHPSFHDGGLLAGAFFDHGTRFLEVSPQGKISEIGYYMPIGGSTTAALWANDEIVYAIDIVHGIDILRFTDAPN